MSMYTYKDTIISSYFECRVSGHEAELLPFGHSRHFPLKFDLHTRKILYGTLNFYNTPFHTHFSLENTLPEGSYTIVTHQTKQALVILNVLDNCFGHSLLKLFHATRFFHEHKDRVDILLILPKALEHFLVHAPGLNSMSVSLGFKALEKCYVLNTAIDTVANLYSEVSVQGTETYGTYDPAMLKKELNLFGHADRADERDKLIFYYRSDYFRMWSGARQKKNIIELFQFLKPLFAPSTKFCVIGDKDKTEFPDWIHDYRVASYGSDMDFRYNELLSQSWICIGLTGSHMLFPSMLSYCTAHLHPVFKYRNMAEDIIEHAGSREMLSAFRHLYYHGNYNCSDITPAKLGTLLLNHFLGLVEKEYKLGDAAVSQETWMETHHRYFLYDKAMALRASINAAENKKIRFRYYLDKILKRIP